jgi:hypothetical protein
MQVVVGAAAAAADGMAPVAHPLAVHVADLLIMAAQA